MHHSDSCSWNSILHTIISAGFPSLTFFFSMNKTKNLWCFQSKLHAVHIVLNSWIKKKIVKFQKWKWKYKFFMLTFKNMLKFYVELTSACVCIRCHLQNLYETFETIRSFAWNSYYLFPFSEKVYIFRTNTENIFFFKFLALILPTLKIKYLPKKVRDLF